MKTIQSIHIQYVQAVKREFRSRKKRNPSYSLRSFARHLELDQSYLTKILTLKRKPTAALILKTAKKVGLDDLEIAVRRASGSHKQVSYQQISDDEFAILSEWQHFAILEYFKTGKPQNMRSIADSLNLSQSIVKESIHRLEKNGFIEKTEKRWHATRENNSWFNPRSNSARRTLQKDLFHKAIESIDETPMERRDHSSLTIRCSKSHMHEVKKRITKFRRSLDRYLESVAGQEDEEIYQLIVGFYPLSKSDRKEENE